LTAGLELPESVAERAAYWFRTAASKGLLNGRSIEAMSAACVYIAARERELPVTKTAVADRSPISEDRVRGHVGVLQAQLSVSIKPSNPQDFLPKLASELSISVAHERRAKELLEAAVTANIHIGKHPAGVAGAAIYTTATNTDTELTQNKVADAADVSPITICRHHQQLQKYHSDKIDNRVESIPNT
jgi:transcription initiation factor TFIIB